jgi:hypothetical protein
MMSLLSRLYAKIVEFLVKAFLYYRSMKFSASLRRFPTKLTNFDTLNNKYILRSYIYIDGIPRPNSSNAFRDQGHIS